MNIHEYQAKEILQKYGVPITAGYVAFNAKEAEAAAKKLTGPLYVVKAQIHAGGRGKGKFKEAPEAKGGVRLSKSIEDVKKNAEDMLGKTLVTIQNAPDGNVVKRLYIQDGVDIKKELYLSLVIDRASSRITIVGSEAGGMDIEEVAHNTPEKIIKLSIDPVTGLQPFHIRQLSFGMGLGAAGVKKLAPVVQGLYNAFVAEDCSQIEINPLAIINDAGDIVALDAKVNFDDNAMFRHPDTEALRDEDEENPLELRAKKHELSYVKMDGNIGCMVNGAGLAMATMDIIKLYGGEPANFLDVGGGATKERVTEAFKIILSDPSVQGILVNIFGGIMRCDIIAEGIIAAAKEVKLSVPLVVRLEGTNVEKGKEILAKSGLAITSANNLADAAEKAVAAIKRKAA